MAANVSYGAATIGTTATLIRNLGGRSALLIYNNGASTIFVGDANDVTVDNGMPIPSGTEREIRSDFAIYGIVASGTVNVRWMVETT